MRLIAALCALVLGSCGHVSTLPIPPPPAVGPVTIADATLFLAQVRCADGRLQIEEPACVDPTMQIAADALVSRRHDWPAGVAYQISDSWMIDRNTFETTWSYPPFGPFSQSNGDGGELYTTDGITVRISATQDGGKPYLQGFYGAGCGGTGWVLFRNDAPTGSWASLVASLTDYPIPSPCRAGTPAFTRYRLESVTAPWIINGAVRMVTTPTVISEHFNAVDLASATALERSFFAAGIGRIVWEAWTTSPPVGAQLPARCPGTDWSTPPAPGWTLSDCRTSTNVQAADGSLTGTAFGWPQPGSVLP